MALFIDSNGIETKITPINGKNFNLQEMQNFVDGFIEIINLPDGRQMVINEEGRIQNLDINDKASVLAGCMIVGNVLVCSHAECD